MLKAEAVKYIVIHCSHTCNAKDYDIETLDIAHRKQGRFGCGHHFVILEDGTIQIGRSLHEFGNHCFKHNEESVSVCLMGKGHFNPVQKANMKCLVNTLSLIFKTAKVIAHEDLDPKGGKNCPGIPIKL